MPKGGNALSRNPNVCASCSSLVDGMGDSDPVKELAEPEELPVILGLRMEDLMAEASHVKA
jgi:hypothetical protein